MFYLYLKWKRKRNWFLRPRLVLNVVAMLSSSAVPLRIILLLFYVFFIWKTSWNKQRNKRLQSVQIWSETSSSGWVRCKVKRLRHNLRPCVYSQKNTTIDDNMSNFQSEWSVDITHYRNIGNTFPNTVHGAFGMNNRSNGGNNDYNMANYYFRPLLLFFVFARECFGSSYYIAKNKMRRAKHMHWMVKVYCIRNVMFFRFLKTFNIWSTRD